MAFYGERFRRPDEEDIWEELKYWLQNPVTAEEIALRKKEEQDYINSIMDLAFPIENRKNKQEPYLSYEELFGLEPQENEFGKTRELYNTPEEVENKPLEATIIKDNILTPYNDEIDNNTNLSEEEKFAKKLEIAQILENSKANLKEIEKDHLKAQAKNYGKAALDIASIIPVAGGAGLIAKGSGALAKKLAPTLGRKFSQVIGKGMKNGAISGATEGAIRGYLEDENPAITAAQDMAIGTALGTAGSAIGGKIAHDIRVKDLDELQDKRKDWGIAYRKLSGKPKEAIEKLLEQKKGFVPKAMKKKGIGDIDFVFGDSRGGLKHIINRRNAQGINGEDFVRQIPNFIKKGKTTLKDTHIDRKYVIEKGNEVAIKQGYNNKPRNWIVSSYKLEEAPPQDLPGGRALEQTYANGQQISPLDLKKVPNNIITNSSPNLNPQVANQTIKAPKSYQEWLEELRRKRKRGKLF